ncbi:HEXXH motif domain-containing protein [Pseudomonas frederiksbergensis]|uniref:HEXXH motif domain-containing protein n=1 Tax=Pseudomonas frederiksbergensis TaxID=104087 RepID=A0A1J0EI64_9PSED|nr:HEXXH motif-containing putative peptide modification protein [Pseudomonas frederiksbergensis]APC15568.1 HEXXH motif domain-containing protein [Pseudomonas frederiksbergensis]
MDIGNSGLRELSDDELFQGTTFLPDAELSRFEVLLERVSRNRYTRFDALYTELFQRFPNAPQLAEFFEQAFNLIVPPTREQRLIINDPVFQVWNVLTAHYAHRVITKKVADTDALEKMLIGFPQMLARVKTTDSVRTNDYCPPVYRFDVDPLVARVAPPSYEFPKDEATRKQLERNGHSVNFFCDVVNIALLRIEHTWPACREQFRKLVKSICYLPDGSFRSCSASRFIGIIFISNRDDSILDLEESLVHEATHQLLYNIVEVCPVVKDETSREVLFTLPWSGQARDFHGYFHEFFVCVALVKYLGRVRSRSSHELQRAQNRLVFILQGLIKALPDFEASTDFTPQGRQLLENLAKEVRGLESHHAGLLAISGTAEGAARLLGMTG